MLVYIQMDVEDTKHDRTDVIIDGLLNVDYNKAGEVIGIEILDGKYLNLEQEKTCECDS